MHKMKMVTETLKKRLDEILEAAVGPASATVAEDKLLVAGFLLINQTSKASLSRLEVHSFPPPPPSS